MGYADPQQNIRSYVDVLNKETKNFINKYDEMFSSLNTRTREAIQANMAIAQQKQIEKSIGQDAYYAEVKKNQPKGGYEKNRNKFLHDLGDLNWENMGINTAEASSIRANIMAAPKTIAELQASFVALKERYDKGLMKTIMTPGSFNYATGEDVVAFLNAQVYDYELRDDGSINVHFEYTYDDLLTGQQKTQKYDMSAKDIIDMSTSGNWGVRLLGDPLAQKKAHQENIKTNSNYSQKVTKEQINSTDEKVIRETYTRANEDFFEALDNSDPIAFYDAKSTDLMRDSWPVILNDAYTAYKTDKDPNVRKKYEELLRPLLAGVDKTMGTKDDVQLPDEFASAADWVTFYNNYAEVGEWNDRNKDQVNLVKGWFNTYDKKFQLLEFNDVVTTRQEKDGPSYSDVTARMNAMARLKPQERAKKYEEDARMWLENSLTVPAMGTNALKNWADLVKQGKGNTEDARKRASSYLNSPKGLQSLGLTPSKNGRFELEADGKVVEITVTTAKDGSKTESREEVGIILDPRADTWATPQNIAKMRSMQSKVYTDTYNQSNTTQDDNNPLNI
jgi:hypothetical protein